MKTTKQSGFTLIELMIVVAIIAIIAAIAIPNLLSARLNANETSAISTLRNISSSQSQFQASAKCDVDNDGTGEFGLFTELSGRLPVRGSTTALNPPVLSGAFRTLNAGGLVSRSGYMYAMFLPTAAGAGGTTDAAGTITYAGGTSFDTDLTETTWCSYAWPANYGNSGNRTFFVNQTGDITSSDVPTYTGPVYILPANGALIAGSSATAITGLVAVGTTGMDGNMWRQVN